MLKFTDDENNININQKYDFSTQNLYSKFVYNDYNKGMNMLSHLEDGLKSCDEFYFSVAFITQSGIIILKNLLAQLEEKNIKGYILTTDYLYFTSPLVFKELMRFKNLKIRIYTQENFHTKGYIFKHKDIYNEYYSLLIGSSNLTQNALKVNKEWNVHLLGLNAENKNIIKNTLCEFKNMWLESEPLTVEWLKIYTANYKNAHLTQNTSRNLATENRNKKFTPNKMQQEALASLKELRDNNQHKALLISATGTGKTYLSAFEIQNVKPKHLLFLAHREQLLKQAMNTFQGLMSDVNMGFLTADDKNFSGEYIFSTITMMSKEEIYKNFMPTYFDYIIIDETHRAGSNSYQKILKYFKPQFLLGMTATPERTDGFDIYKLFDYNIAYEIRLKKAMEENMLCPFHYFGITDISINNREIDDTSSFNDLTAQKRVDYIIEKSQFYGYSGERLKGLVFCRKIEEAYTLSEMFNKKGFNTVALCGKDSQKIREDALARLEQNNRIGGLDYIFTVDILNEGIDVPAINQIIMLRPTQSAIIFVQQLGRGLRKFKSKEYVVILDFIGNYQNNFMIPIALSGDISYNKDNIRRYVAEGSRIIPGASTINFDAVSRQKIYAAIDSAKLSEAAFLKAKYLDLKQKTGKIPEITDFVKLGTIDITKYFDKFGSYYNFLKKYEKNYEVDLNSTQEEILSYICQRFAKGKRIYELIVLKYILLNFSNIYKQNSFRIREILMNYDAEFNIDMLVEKSIVNNLTNTFTIKNEQEKYKNCVFIQKMKQENVFTVHRDFAENLKTKSFYKILLEIINFALMRYKKYYANHYIDTDFVLYQKYTYEEVCYLLNWQQKINPNAMAGYFYEKTTRTMPVFINYIDPKNKRVDYPNEFLSNQCITAYSKTNRKLDSKDAQHIYNAQKEQNKLYLFVRKPNNDKEAKEFYFLGQITAEGKPEYIAKYNGFKIIYQLKTPVRKDIFDYFIN